MVNTGPTEEVVSVFFSEQMPLFLDQIESQLGKTDSTFVAGEKVSDVKLKGPALHLRSR